jgi:LysM repeat protein
MPKLRPAFRLYLFAMALLLAACGQPTPLPTPTPDPRSAAVSEVVQTVETRAGEGQTYAQVTTGYVLRGGGQVRTGQASKARLDISDGTILRLAQNSSFTLEDITPFSGGVLARLQLEAGKLWVSLTGGTLQVETPVGVASVRGSFAVIQYSPGDPANPDDDLLVLDCLEGACTAQNDNVDARLGNLERVVMNHIGQMRMTLTGADVEAFLRENPEGQRLVMTLTAALGAQTRLATPTPSTTPQIPLASATPSNTPLAPPTATPSATPVPPAAVPPIPLIGKHIVQSGETLFCIGRAYGVLPTAIARANGLPTSFDIFPGQALGIPAVQWLNIVPGPVCATQFVSPYPGLPTATPTMLPTLTLTPTATCMPGNFYDPFQKRCRPPDKPPAADTATPVLPPPETPEPPTPTFIPPDVTGPNVDTLAAFPTTVDNFTTCRVTFTANASDPSGVASAEVRWTAFAVDTGGSPVSTGSGSQPMTFVSVSGLTYLVQFDVVIPLGGYLDWKVVATDNAGNETTSDLGPRIQTGDSGCPGQVP